MENTPTSPLDSLVQQNFAFDPNDPTGSLLSMLGPQISAGTGFTREMMARYKGGLDKLETLADHPPVDPDEYRMSKIASAANSVAPLQINAGAMGAAMGEAGQEADQNLYDLDWKRRSYIADLQEKILSSSVSHLSNLSMMGRLMTPYNFGTDPSGGTQVRSKVTGKVETVVPQGWAKNAAKMKEDIYKKQLENGATPEEAEKVAQTAADSFQADLQLHQNNPTGENTTPRSNAASALHNMTTLFDGNPDPTATQRTDDARKQLTNLYMPPPGGATDSAVVPRVEVTTPKSEPSMTVTPSDQIARDKDRATILAHELETEQAALAAAKTPEEQATHKSNIEMIEQELTTPTPKYITPQKARTSEAMQKVNAEGVAKLSEQAATEASAAQEKEGKLKYMIEHPVETGPLRDQWRGLSTYLVDAGLLNADKAKNANDNTISALMQQTLMSPGKAYFGSRVTNYDEQLLQKTGFSFATPTAAARNLMLINKAEGERAQAHNQFLSDYMSNSTDENGLIKTKISPADATIKWEKWDKDMPLIVYHPGERGVAPSMYTRGQFETEFMQSLPGLITKLKTVNPTAAKKLESGDPATVRQYMITTANNFNNRLQKRK